MKISFSWLKQYIDLDISPEKTAELLTGCGLEVETIKGVLAGCVIGEVKTKEKHPNADRLSVCTVDIGTGTLLSIVCGAPNVEAGQKVVVATVGSTIYPVKGEPLTIQKAKIRGVISEGMICAEDEIGMGESHEGIMVLDSSAKIGTPAKVHFGIEEDYIFEIGLTPNRSDAASHIGVAKDLYAVLNWNLPKNKYQLNVPFVDDFPETQIGNKSGKIEALVEDTNACIRYSGITIYEVAVKESPDWLKKRLQSIGLKPINNIVDVTNFVLHETGQPLHCFDADKISGEKIIVKKLSGTTKFVALDGVERTITENDLLICNAKEPMCIAGVMGGIKSGVTNETKNIFLESACFLPASIRQTSKAHGLKTDASFRFERGTDPNITVYALERAALLIKEIAGGNISSDMIDIYPSPVEEKKVSFSFYGCNRLLGKIIDKNSIKRIFTLLGMEIVTEGDDALLIEVPTDKTDITSEEDLVEEILRIYGCDNIEIPSTVRSSLSYISKPDTGKIQNTISDLLCGSGFTEIMTNSLTNSEYLSISPLQRGGGGIAVGDGAGGDVFEEGCPPKDGLRTSGRRGRAPVFLLNPLSPELNILRPTLLFGGMEAIAYNQNRKNPDLKLFEFGKVYSNNPEYSGQVPRNSPLELGYVPYTEETHLALFLCGKKQRESWNSKRADVDFFFLKTYVDNILKRLGINIEKISEISSEIFSFGLFYISGNKKIVEFGCVKKNILKKFDIRQDVFFADFNWECIMELVKNHSVRYKTISKFPAVRRDLALVVDKNVKYEFLKSLAFQTERNLLKQVNLFDVYEGNQIEQGKKSYALSFILQNEDATLTDNEVDRVMQKLIKTYQEKAGATLRA
jgi:phenylalanyl-tRNA synthetase beta chain